MVVGGIGADCDGRYETQPVRASGRAVAGGGEIPARKHLLFLPLSTLGRPCLRTEKGIVPMTRCQGVRRGANTAVALARSKRRYDTKGRIKRERRAEVNTQPSPKTATTIDAEH